MQGEGSPLGRCHSAGPSRRAAQAKYKPSCRINRLLGVARIQVRPSGTESRHSRPIATAVEKHSVGRSRESSTSVCPVHLRQFGFVGAGRRLAEERPPSPAAEAHRRARVGPARPNQRCQARPRESAQSLLRGAPPASGLLPPPPTPPPPPRPAAAASPRPPRPSLRPPPTHPR